MKMSQLYAPTLRETPAEAEIISHQLMLRAGMIRKAAGGMYSYLPLAYRVLKKIEQIVREEMNAEGGQELLMPIIQPAEIWKETGRWDVYGEEMFRLKDRHGREFCLGPTHEEIITTLVRLDVKSYRQLPLLLYQIQNKYRDEIRPRFGLMRGREFIMKDLYSFDRDEEGLNTSYWKMYNAYSRIFTRCGLNFRPVEADPGAIGGSGSHEFMAFADSGEAAIAFCPQCDFAANVEKAELAPEPGSQAEPLAMQKVATPGARTIQEVSEFLNLAASDMIKSMALITEHGPVLALLRGDHELNVVKLKNLLDCLRLDFADDETVVSLGSVPGFLGPVNLSGWKIVADASVMNLANAVCGANKADYHYINVNPGRDFNPDIVADIRLIREGDACPRCGAPVNTARGIEVGQVFKLFTKYSKPLKATFLDETGREIPFVMGSYGIGIGRTMAAIIEQNNDANGIAWPAAVAPFAAAVVPVNCKDPKQMELAEEIYQTLNASGVEAVLDDRDERPGVKFKDADLIGYPLRFTVGSKAIQDDQVEIKVRKTGQVFLKAVSSREYLSWAKELLRSL